MKKLLRFISLFLVLFSFGNDAFAENFYIKNYDVKMKVSEDKSVQVVENIDAYFTSFSHGIIRNIPLGENSVISGVKISEESRINCGASRCSFKIGNPDKFVKGSHHYTISYVHIIKDKPDEFYYNIIGTEWDLPIEQATFNIEMPKPFDAQSVGVSIGRYGLRGFAGRAEYSVNGNTISGKTLRKLSPGEGITIRIALPGDYFKFSPGLLPYAAGFLLLVCTLAGYFIWFFIGRDNHVTPVVNFYPPQGYNSAEAEVLYKGVATVNGLVSLIPWLANKGYIKIIQQGSMFSFIKLKDYDGDNPHVAEFMNGMMDKKEVTSSSLKTSTVFYRVCEKVIEGFNGVRKRIFDPASIGFGYNFLMLLFSAVELLIVYSALCGFNLAAMSANFHFLIFIVISVFLLFVPVVDCFLVIWCLLFGGVPLLLIILNVGRMTNIPVVLLGLISLIFTGICFYQLPKRNRLGNQELGKLLGFKKFLETVEKPRLKAIMAENPNYTYEILPYLYIFGLAEKWMDKFEDLFATPPDWYVGSDFRRGFVVFPQTFGSLTVPSVENGGISRSTSSCGGGGFSGGGFGGGGGSSW